MQAKIMDKILRTTRSKRVVLKRVVLKRVVLPYSSHMMLELDYGDR